MKILIIKFAAIGDVLRTTPLLRALRKKYPKAKIYWLTQNVSFAVLSNNNFIDRLFIYNRQNLNRLKRETFDLLISLDKDKGATYAAVRIPAKIKKGFGRNNKGELTPFDTDSDYAYRLGIDDELKFKKNKKTYQQISFEQSGLKYRQEPYIFNLYKKDIYFADKKLKSRGLEARGLKVGIVTGAGKVFAGKRLALSSYVKIIKGLVNLKNTQVLLLGGPGEKQTNKRLSAIFKNSVIDTGCDNTIGQFAAIINNCNVVITGDTLTMHLGIALRKHVIVFFGSTSQSEIELYKKGTKIIPKLKCAPCYKRICPIGERCMAAIKPERIIEEVKHASAHNFST